MLGYEEGVLEIGSAQAEPKIEKLVVEPVI